ncbi:MAG: hypothetical protein ABEJ06_04115 [Haloarculaceae archaeon]
MRRPRTPRQGWAKVSLGISTLFAALLVGYFFLTGNPLYGFASGALVVAAGVYEYRRNRQAEVAAERYEAEANASRRRDRQ